MVLRSSSSNLTELDLSNNDIMDSGVEMLSEGLKNINCRVKIIRLSGCQVTEIGCQSLVAALKSSSSPVKELDLRYNHPGESGKQQLSAIADDPQSSLITVRLEYCGEHRLKPGMKKYGVPLTLDKNTAGRKVVLLNHRKARRKGKNEDDVPYPDHPDRFKRSQVLCKEGLSNLCYWEVEWKGNVGIAASYQGINRNQWDSSAGLGTNPISWNLNLSEKTPTKHSCKGWPANENKELVSEKLPNTFPKIGVLLDWEGGTLDYYSVSSAKPILIHRFQAQFTEPVYPGFWFKRGCVSLCD